MQRGNVRVRMWARAVACQTHHLGTGAAYIIALCHDMMFWAVTHIRHAHHHGAPQLAPPWHGHAPLVAGMTRGRARTGEGSA